MSEAGQLQAGDRVVVAMSGGVDSSVVAALLVERGFEVVGVTLQLYHHGSATGRSRTCCAGQDVRDARAVAELLRIPHYVLDFEERFREAVIDDFVDSYAAGRTPIPCIRCNQRVKFRDLLGIAQDLGAAALATGHYVRKIRGPRGSELHRAHDTRRDQSYFLFATTQAQLDFLEFPLGDLKKDQTREIAGRLALPVAAKPDSQDICFVPSGDYAETVRRRRPGAARAGDIVHVDGRRLGEHRGVVDFTVGQRRGLGVALHERLYVVGIDADRARIVVGPRDAALCAEMELEELNWLAPPESVIDREVLVKHRYNEPAVPARVEALPSKAGARVVFGEAQRGVAPGQACVVYAGDRLLGGGWIARAPLLHAVGATGPVPAPASP